MGEHKHGYNEDVILWSKEQAEALRAGRWSELDLEHLADEIEDVGKSETGTQKPNGHPSGPSHEMALPAGSPGQQLDRHDKATTSGY